MLYKTQVEKNKLLVDFGIYFSEIRDKSGFRTKSDLAEVSGVAVSTISRIESGIHKANPETLKKLSLYLKDTSYEDLLKATGYIDSTNNSDIKEKDDNPISVSFRDDGKDLTPEEEEYLEQQLQQFREWRKRFQKD